MGMFILVTGEPGSGRRNRIDADSEMYAAVLQRCVFILPLEGFEMKYSKQIDLHKVGNTRKPDVIEIVIPDTFDRAEKIEKWIPKLKECLLVIPCCPEYLPALNIALANREENDIDILLIRNTIKDLQGITTIVPDGFIIHSDKSLQISKVLAAELSGYLGQDSAIAFLIAQWVVNIQQEINMQEVDEIYKQGFYLVMEGGKIITRREKPDAIESLRELILTHGTDMIRSRFLPTKGPIQSDEETRSDILDYLD